MIRKCPRETFCWTENLEDDIGCCEWALVDFCSSRDSNKNQNVHKHSEVPFGSDKEWLFEQKALKSIFFELLKMFFETTTGWSFFAAFSWTLNNIEHGWQINRKSKTILCFWYSTAIFVFHITTRSRTDETHWIWFTLWREEGERICRVSRTI